MDDLIAFITARLAEDEAAAKLARPDYFTFEVLGIFSALGDMRHVIRHDPARVLRELAAKRAILSEHIVGGWHPVPCLTLRALASVYSDHPDYRAEWKP